MVTVLGNLFITLNAQVELTMLGENAQQKQDQQPIHTCTKLELMVVVVKVQPEKP